jgi:hypothetical protein
MNRYGSTALLDCKRHYAAVGLYRIVNCVSTTTADSRFVTRRGTGISLVTRQHNKVQQRQRDFNEEVMVVDNVVVVAYSPPRRLP